MSCSAALAMVSWRPRSRDERNRAATGQHKCPERRGGAPVHNADASRKQSSESSTKGAAPRSAEVREGVQAKSDSEPPQGDEGAGEEDAPPVCAEAARDHLQRVGGGVGVGGGKESWEDLGRARTTHLFR